MEVHAHSHTARKKWTHYFWEFLMLFLAVFCGFLAENFREHQIEKSRGKQYMISMVEDLATDTLNINRTIAFASQISMGLDSLQENMYNTDSASANTLTLYRQNAIYVRLVAIDFSDQTAIQLRNSGNMRLIRNLEITNAISRYWKGISTIDNMGDNYEKRLNDLAAAGYNIFNRKYARRGNWDSTSYFYSVIIDPAARLMTYDKNTLINYGNHLDRMIGLINSFFIPRLNTQKERGTKLIRLIKKRISPVMKLIMNN